jgi:maleylacetoacetate isomerase
MHLTLYSYWRSSASHRVRLALGYKGIAHDVITVNLLGGEQSSDEHIGRAPSGYVPALKIDDESFVESVAIIELLDDLFPQKPLYPRTAVDRARVRALVETVNAGIQPLQNLNVLTRYSTDHAARDAWARHYNARGLEVFERLMERNDARGVRGKFAYGDEFTAADALLIPQVGAAKRFGVDMTKLPRVSAVIAHSAELPFVVSAAPENQPDTPNK